MVVVVVCVHVCLMCVCGGRWLHAAAESPCLWDGAGEQRKSHLVFISLVHQLFSVLLPLLQFFPCTKPAQRLCGFLACISSLCPHQVSGRGLLVGEEGRAG